MQWGILWSPGAFWVSAWFTVNVTLAVLNKWVFQFSHFEFPLTLSVCHLTCCAIFSWGLILTGVVPTSTDGSHGPWSGSMWLLSLLFWCNIAVGNWSLQLASLALSQVVRSIIPVMTMGLSFFILQKRFAMPVVLSVSIVVVGVILTTITDVEIHTAGIVVLLVGSLLSSLKVVMTNRFLVGTKSLHPIELLARLSPIALTQMVAYGMLSGELMDVVASWQTIGTASNLTLIGASSFLSFFINYTNFMTNKTTSPVTLTVAGNLKQITVIVISFTVFHSTAKPVTLIGICTTVVGCVLYGWRSELAPRTRTPVDDAPERRPSGQELGPSRAPVRCRPNPSRSLIDNDAKVKEPPTPKVVAEDPIATEWTGLPDDVESDTRPRPA